ncbi:MAG TPA: hypothetical protein VGO16_03135 [Pseudonocardiaceae bacterium]|jgi:hypothetical protein|nr:hypothetical protein [Pseudonocardiaceae bacterium]
MIRRTFVASWVDIVAATGAAVLLAVALPPSAQAATGVFHYYDARGTVRSVTNPAPGACLRTVDAGRATNDTNGRIELYGSPDCDVLIRTVEPGEGFQGGFNSAKVG